MDTLNIDRKKLIGQVAEKLNVLITEDDPVFATVILNELVLSEFVDVARLNLLSLVSHIEELKTSIPAASDEAAGKLEIQAEKILSSAQQLGQGLNEVTKQADAHIQAAANSAAELVKLDIRQGAVKSVKEAIQQSTKDLEETLTKIKGIGGAVEGRLTSIAEKAIYSIDDARIKFESQRNRLVFYCFAACLGALFIHDVVAKIFYK